MTEQVSITVISDKITEMPAITEVFGIELPKDIQKPAYMAREIVYTINGREDRGLRSVVVEDLSRSSTSIIASIIAALNDDSEAEAELRDESGIDYR